MLILGIDTGGTYTDAALLDADTKIITGKTKSFTTRQDLTLCIRRCLEKLPSEHFGDIAMVCLSTTLATNAVVEGNSGRVGLLLMGRMPEGKLPTAQWKHIGGLLDIKGRVHHEVDPQEVRDAAESFRGQVDAVAVSGFASVRNPEQELQVAGIVHRALGVPVVCAHQLSASLGYYERTVTAAINAGLIPKIDGLIVAVQKILTERGINAPVMVVRGDGSLIRDEEARERPIETILSGPAASIVGGLALSGVKDALLLDMGGTTSDIACAADGKVLLNRLGATVGGWRTMVRAAEIATFGMGGDSLIEPDPAGRLLIGPRRVRPLCVAAAMHPALAETLAVYEDMPDEALSLRSHVKFYARMADEDTEGLTPAEQGVLAELSEGPRSVAQLADALGVDAAQLPLEDMARRELLLPIALTPTDILHAEGGLALWDGDAARAGAAVVARKMGLPLDDLLKTAREAISAKLTACCVESAVRFVHGEQAAHSQTLQSLVASALAGGDALLAPRFSLKKPLVAMGAPVAAWLPPVSEVLGTQLVIPPHAEVANAVGAALGQVRAAAEALVRPDKESGTYTAYAPQERRSFPDRDAAETWALAAARTHAEQQSLRWGAANPVLGEVSEPVVLTTRDGDAVYVETRITVEAIGNPSAIVEGSQ